MGILSKSKTKYVEDAEQKALFDWAAYIPEIKDVMFHIPNGGYRNPKEAARLKAQGVRKGVSDIFLPIPRNGFCGLWIEMKAPKAQGRPVPKTTSEQMEWLRKMKGYGYQAAVCYGWEEAKNDILQYMEWKEKKKVSNE